MNISVVENTFWNWNIQSPYLIVIDGVAVEQHETIESAEISAQRLRHAAKITRRMIEKIPFESFMGTPSEYAEYLNESATAPGTPDE